VGLSQGVGSFGGVGKIGRSFVSPSVTGGWGMEGKGEGGEEGGDKRD
jgi:hypothetical protein